MQSYSHHALPRTSTPLAESTLEEKRTLRHWQRRGCDSVTSCCVDGRGRDGSVCMGHDRPSTKGSFTRISSTRNGRQPLLDESHLFAKRLIQYQDSRDITIRRHIYSAEKVHHSTLSLVLGGSFNYKSPCVEAVLSQGWLILWCRKQCNHRGQLLFSIIPRAGLQGLTSQSNAGPV